MDNKEFSRDLERRTRKLAIEIIGLSKSLPNTIEARVIRSQITKSGTSIGANYSEANRSRSKADFISKIKICESEANETIYWLNIIEDLKWINSSDLQVLKNEAGEILAIFTSVNKKLKELNT